MPCPERLPPLADGTGREVVLTMQSWAAQYHRCAMRNNGLIEVVKGL
ncbi:hypothetical protein PU634_05175 [Oceanimonas pelagia]|uniref:Uncharacterized protein n=1 Tax=Oceanimonas pelagia TaxID=3028314 RepID=A0AA50KPS2_9GAMM|nr:hypothetical protein [Oceanimonas pelagia]WMC11760.1 hypothetical protein PU634_05175 [Oceanimonas pelagia]